MSYLDDILFRKRIEVAARKQKKTVKELAEEGLYERTCASLVRAFKGMESAAGVIAEFKRASPSLGVFSTHNDCGQVAKDYAQSGALGVSILTDNEGFSGTLDDLEAARAEVDIPLLRKDFILDPYQLHEAKAFGADVVLLIAAALEVEKCKELALEAKSLGLEVLLEIHGESEIAYISPEISILGVNNRDLHSFEVSIETSIALAKKLPKDIIKISESGIATPQDAKRLIEVGYDGFLVGASFMKSSNPGAACRSFIDGIIRELQTP